MTGHGASCTDTATIGITERVRLTFGTPSDALEDDEEVYPGGFLALNDDDDNDNGVVDMEETGLDPDVKPLRVWLNAGLTEGTVTLSAPSGVGRLKLYEDAARTTAVPLPKTWQAADLAGDPVTLYVQGILVSNGTRDVRLSLNYTGPEETCWDTIRLTVFKVVLDATPSSIAASSTWPDMPDISSSAVTVQWQPADLNGTLEIAEVQPMGDYQPPDPGILEHTGPTVWRYIAFDEPPNEICLNEVKI